MAASSGSSGPPPYAPPPTQPGPRRGRVAVVVALVLGLLVTLGLAAGGAWWLMADGEEGSASARPAPPEPTGPVPAGPEELADFYDQELDWYDCGGRSECAELTVPLDYAEPEGDTVDLALLRVPARDRENRIGQLVINPGGPGASGVEFADLGALAVGRDVSRSYDIVGFDPRGVGESPAIECSTEALDAVLAAPSSPDTPEEVESNAELNLAFAEDCVENSGEIVEHASTVATVRDMDVLRAALGEPELDYLGYSYGTQLGSLYATLFPETVGRMVLDGAVGPNLTIEELALGQARGFQTAFDAYVQDCLDQGECPLGDSFDDARAGVADFIEERESEPLQTGEDRELTGGLAYGAVVRAMYVREYWPLLTEAFRVAIEDDDGSQLLALADDYSSRGDDGYQTNLLMAFTMIQCLDYGGDAIPPQDVEEQLPRWQEASPTFGSSFAGSLSQCYDWPVEPTEAQPEITGAGAPPIVVVGTTRDNATPYEWAVDLTEAMESAVLVTRDGDGHLGFNRGNACVDEAVVGYLLEGTVPEAGLEC